MGGVGGVGEGRAGWVGEVGEMCWAGRGWAGQDWAGVSVEGEMRVGWGEEYRGITGLGLPPTPFCSSPQVLELIVDLFRYFAAPKPRVNKRRVFRDGGGRYKETPYYNNIYGPPLDNQECTAMFLSARSNGDAGGFNR